MATIKDMTDRAGDLPPDDGSGKSLKRRLQDETHIYDGRSDRTSTYTEPEVLRAVALYKLYGSYTRASEETGIPVNTISNWINGRTAVLSKIGNFSEKLDNTYNMLIDNSVFLMTEAQKQIYERLPDASAAQAATIYGILADKVRYMTEGSKSQTSTSLHFDLAGLSGDQQAALLDRALQRQQQREDERAAIDAEFVAVEQDEDEPQQPQEDDEKRRQKKKFSTLRTGDRKLRKILE